MLEFFRRLPLLECGGKVACPARGRDVDVETCAGCGALDKITLQGNAQLVRCHPADDRTLAVVAYPR